MVVENGDAASIENLKLDLQLPAGIVPVGQTTSSMWALGGLATSTSVRQDVVLIALSNPDSLAVINVRATYASGNRSFESHGSSTISLGVPALRFTVTGPANTVSGSPVALALHYVNNTSHLLSSARLILNHPPAFTLETSSVPMLEAGVWGISALPSGASGTIMVAGTLVSPTAGAYEFSGRAELALASGTYSLMSPAMNIVLSQPPLSIVIVPNGTSTYISKPGDSLLYAITYENHASVALRGVALSAKLTGSMFDPSSLVSDGSFNSLTKTITWSSSVVPAFASLAPGATGVVTFRVRTLPTFPITRPTDQNFSLRVDGVISSPTILPGVVATSTTSIISLTTKLGGSVFLSSRAYRYDDTSGFVNSGPYPPVVDRETRYTIHWSISDTANALRDVVVSSTLPAGVSFVGVARSNINTVPQYDPRTGIVTWRIPSVPSGAGIVVPSPEAIFQVANTPAVNQVGGSLTIFGDAKLQAQDSFTSQALFASAPLMSSQLKDDPVASKIRDTSVRAQ